MNSEIYDAIERLADLAQDDYGFDDDEHADMVDMLTKVVTGEIA